MSILPSILFFLVVFSFAEPSHAVKKAYVVYLGSHLHARDILIDHQGVADGHRDFMASILGSREKAEDAIFLSYTKVINGFAANLEDDDAKKLAGHPNVISVFPNKGRKIRGDIRLSRYLGLQDSHYRVPSDSLWAKTKFGQDIIIGVIDSGVKSEELNFNDYGYTSIPSKWKGVCQNDTIPLEKGGVRCNKKLIGARYFQDGVLNHVKQKRHENKTSWDAVLTLNFFTPRDTLGHGTLAMSLAASRPISGVYIGCERPSGVVQGTAPAARIASYKVSYQHLPDKFECLDADILAAFDSAIHDGVDVISLSIGSDDLDLNVTDLHDAVAIGSFHALMEGIPTVACQGNLDEYDQNYKYQDNAIPWVLSVGSTFMNKQYLATVNFGNNKDYMGASLYKADVNPLPEGRFFPITDFHSVDDVARRICINGSFHRKEVEGRIVMCMKHNIIENVNKPLDALKEAGSVGAILVDDVGNYPRLFFGSLPYVEISLEDLSDDTFQDIMKDSNPVASFTHTKVRFGRPYVCYISTPGPNKNNPGIFKPDVVAPGVIFNIVGSELRDIHELIGGTSFSTPITAGVVALLKALHPDWSTSAIKSALMTTARRVTKREVYYTDPSMGKLSDNQLLESTPFDAGAGQIDPPAAADPGLVYDNTIEEYFDFLCSQGFSSDMIAKFTLRSYTCPCKMLRDIDLNYPAIVVPDYTGRITVRRRLKNVGTPGRYKVKVHKPPHIKVVVEPKVLEFASIGEEKTFSVTFEATGAFNVSYGSITWKDGVHKVTSPLVLWVKSHVFLLAGSSSYRGH